MRLGACSSRTGLAGPDQAKAATGVARLVEGWYGRLVVGALAGWAGGGGEERGSGGTSHSPMSRRTRLERSQRAVSRDAADMVLLKAEGAVEGR